MELISSPTNFQSEELEEEKNSSSLPAFFWSKNNPVLFSDLFPFHNPLDCGIVQNLTGTWGRGIKEYKTGPPGKFSKNLLLVN